MEVFPPTPSDVEMIASPPPTTTAGDAAMAADDEDEDATLYDEDQPPATEVEMLEEEVGDVELRSEAGGGVEEDVDFEEPPSTEVEVEVEVEEAEPIQILLTNENENELEVVEADEEQQEQEGEDAPRTEDPNVHVPPPSTTDEPAAAGSLSPEAESIVLVEKPSVTELENLAAKEEAAKEEKDRTTETDPEAENHENEDENELDRSTVPTEVEQDSGEDEEKQPLHIEPSDEHDHEIVVSGTFDLDEDHIEEEEPVPIILTYPPTSPDNAEPGQSYSLFLPEPTLSLPVLLSGNGRLYDASLTEVFDALREDAAFSVHAPEFDDRHGSLEWVLEHSDPQAELRIGEDSIHARHISLADFARLHRICEFPPPLTLRLVTGQPRFGVRRDQIEALKREMDREASGDEEHNAGEEAEDSCDEGEVDELGWHGEDPDFSEDGDLDKDEHDAAPHDSHLEERTDHPNGPDDPILPSEQHRGPAAEAEDHLGAGADAAEDSQDEVDDDGEDSRVIEDTKLVITATGDLEVLATVQQAKTSHGGHDERADAAGREFFEHDGAENRGGDSTPASVAEKESAVPKEDDVLSHEVEREAAEATTKGGEMENAPVSPEFDVSQTAEEALQPNSSNGTSLLTTRRFMRLHPDLASAGDFTPEHELYADSPVPTPATEDGTQPAGSTSPKRRHEALADEEGGGEAHEDEAPDSKRSRAE